MLALEKDLSVNQTYICTSPQTNKEYANSLIMKVCEFVKKWEALPPHLKDTADSILGEYDHLVNRMIQIWPNFEFRDKTTAAKLNPIYKKFFEQFPVSLEACVKTNQLIRNSKCFLIIPDKLCVNTEGIAIQARIIDKSTTDSKLSALYIQNAPLLKPFVKGEIYFCCLQESFMNTFNQYTKILARTELKPEFIPNAITSPSESTSLLNRSKEPDRNCLLS